MTAPRRDHRIAFTLTELLIVIVIIAILAALLFSVFGRITARSRTAECVSNLRQVGASILAYTGDHDGVLPPAWMRKSKGAQYDQYWPGILVAGKYLTAPSSPDIAQVPTKSVLLCPAANRQADTSWSVGTSPATLDKAQVFAAVYEDATGTVYYHTSYAINASTAYATWPFVQYPKTDTDGVVESRLVQLEKPSQTVMLYDGKGMHNTSSVRIKWQHEDLQKTCFVFFDGHAEALSAQAWDVSNVDAFPRFKK